MISLQLCMNYRYTSSVVTTTFVILCLKKPANPGLCGKWLKKWRERERERERVSKVRTSYCFSWMKKNLVYLRFFDTSLSSLKM